MIPLSSLRPTEPLPPHRKVSSDWWGLTAEKNPGMLEVVCGDRHLVATVANYNQDYSVPILQLGFPGRSVSKESACNAGDPGLIPGSGRSPGEGNGYPLQYSYLENSMDGGAWWTSN